MRGSKGDAFARSIMKVCGLNIKFKISIQKIKTSYFFTKLPFFV